MPKITKTCINCKQPFKTHRDNHKVCTKACKRAARRRYCEVCGEAYDPGNGRQRYCSRACKGESSRRIILQGTRFSNLVVLGVADINRFGKSQLKCQCDCGNTFVVASNNLSSGNTKSCGCTSKHATSSEQNTYKYARRRCMNPRDKDYGRYGGRGIEWRFKSFKEFYSYLGPRPSPNHSLERLDNDGHYEPSNVVWGTGHQQYQNRRKTYTKR